MGPFIYENNLDLEIKVYLNKQHFAISIESDVYSFDLEKLLNDNIGFCVNWWYTIIQYNIDPIEFRVFCKKLAKNKAFL